MSYIANKDFCLEVALGNVSGYSCINKFGQAPDADSGTLTDVWDGADGTTSTDIWVAPTAARVHAIVSNDTNDTSAGTGLQTCRVYGLTDWDTAETSEVVSMNGTTPVNTSSSYVIIHRMKSLTFGSGGTNAGIVTATAATDSTITAAIQAGEGQTLMAIYGVPSTQTLHLTQIYASVLKSIGVGAVKVDATLLVKENADLATSGFITKERFQYTDQNSLHRDYCPVKSVTGPAIVKMQVETNVANSVATAAFDAYLVNN